MSRCHSIGDISICLLDSMLVEHLGSAKRMPPAWRPHASIAVEQLRSRRLRLETASECLCHSRPPIHRSTVVPCTTLGRVYISSRLNRLMCESGTSIIDTLSHERYTVAVRRNTHEPRQRPLERRLCRMTDAGSCLGNRIESTVELYERHWA